MLINTILEGNLSYKELKDRSLISITNNGKGYLLNLIKFDPDTGVRLLPIGIVIDIAQLTLYLNDLKKKVESVQAMLDDCK